MVFKHREGVVTGAVIPCAGRIRATRTLVSHLTSSRGAPTSDIGVLLLEAAAGARRISIAATITAV